MLILHMFEGAFLLDKAQIIIIFHIITGNYS